MEVKFNELHKDLENKAKLTGKIGVKSKAKLTGKTEGNQFLFFVS